LRYLDHEPLIKMRNISMRRAHIALAVLLRNCVKRVNLNSRHIYSAPFVMRLINGPYLACVPPSACSHIDGGVEKHSHQQMNR